MTQVTLPLVLLILTLQRSIGALAQIVPDGSTDQSGNPTLVPHTDEVVSAGSDREASIAASTGDTSIAAPSSTTDVIQPFDTNESGSSEGAPFATAGPNPSATAPWSDSVVTSSTAAAQATEASSWQLTRGDVDSAPLVQLRLLSDMSKCLALPSDQPQVYDPISMVDCSVQEDRLQWRYVDGLTQVKSALAGGQEWCLDGGEANEVYQTVTVNKCQGDIASQMWWYTGPLDGHFAMYNQSRCMDLENGSMENGGRLQTWQCFFGNTNQMWMATAV